MVTQIVTDFVRTPSAELLNSMTKDQLIEVAELYKIVVSLLQRLVSLFSEDWNWQSAVN